MRLATKQALTLGVALLLFCGGLLLLRGAGLVSGGTPGLALLAHYWLGGPVGMWLVAVSLPLVVVAAAQLGAAHIGRCIGVTLAAALVTDLLWAVVGERCHLPLMVAPLAGVAIGAALVLLMNQRLTLAGFNLLALVLEQRWGWHSARTLLIADSLVLLLSAGLHAGPTLGWSLTVVVAVALTLRLGYRPPARTLQLVAAN